MLERNEFTFTNKILNSDQYQKGELLHLNVHVVKDEEKKLNFKTLKVSVIDKNGKTFYGDLNYSNYIAYFEKYGVDIKDCTGYIIYFKLKEVKYTDDKGEKKVYNNVQYLNLQSTNEKGELIILPVEWVEN